MGPDLELITVHIDIVLTQIIQIYVIHLYETHYNVNNRLESLSVQLFIVIIADYHLLFILNNVS